MSWHVEAACGEASPDDAGPGNSRQGKVSFVYFPVARRGKAKRGGTGLCVAWHVKARQGLNETMNSWNHNRHDAELIHFYWSGWTYPRISKTMGFSKSTLQDHARELGLQKRRPTPVRFSPEVIAALAKAAVDPTLKSWEDVGSAVGISAQQAQDAVRRHGLKKMRRFGGDGSTYWSAEMDRRLIDLVNDGVRPISRIAAKLEVTKNTISGRLWRLGIFLKEKETEVSFYHHPLMSVPLDGCVWPNIDPDTPATEFCGKSHAGPGLPYCGEHMKLAYITDPKRLVLTKTAQPQIRDAA